MSGLSLSHNPFLAWIIALHKTDCTGAIKCPTRGFSVVRIIADCPLIFNFSRGNSLAVGLASY